MQDREVELVKLEPMDLLAVSHIGPYMKIGDAFYTLAQWLAERNVRTAGSKMVGIYYDDPNTVEASKLRSKAALHLGEETDVEVISPVEKFQLRGGEHARVLHVGPYQGLQQAWMWFYNDGLQKLGRKPDFSMPSFEVYLNTPDEAAPEDLKTELYIPLA
ncbi:AraC family transcriptional regulator [Paraburkholderia bannensis]|uniref:AraC family transcriptional regulator n=1 Tax=Paraburkholderia bannensis TaxID=765414 RepID=A0A7W9TVA0_9BURK|nr:MULTISPECIES: GyrI-like domain-containing protein [Paraburkholderia]MBB3256000.1 AraC family transcriptional regulator [Paraburkholderia sp. WP4_3_2]MBB6101000.1 AraC family transcriptional regulator [Paraburkholderia bannensis]